MPASEERLPLDRLRDAVAGGVAARSLRQVARDVGMSPTGLQKFLDGSTPYSATRRKLERWYVRESARYGGGPGLGTALAALDILTQDLAGAARSEARQAIVDALLAAHEARRRPPPAWLVQLRDAIDRGTEPGDPSPRPGGGSESRASDAKQRDGR